MSFAAFKKLADNRLKFGLFLLARLPSAFICGVRVRSLSETTCVTSVPYKWLSQNPFRSTYFACQAMAAEMSTGLLCLGHSYRALPPDMLVVKLEAVYFKKATERVYFTCPNGDQVRQAIAQSRASGEGVPVECLSTGRNRAGELISEFRITWSFKVRQA